MTVLDYEVLVRQKRDAMLADAVRQRTEAQRARDEDQRFGFRARLAALRARFGARGRKTVAAPAA